MKLFKVNTFSEQAINSFQIQSYNQKTIFLLSLLLLMFLGSGAAALIYEVIWFQLLEVVIGSSAFSLAILLSVYMGGLFLGSLLWPSLLSRSSNSLRLYALFEAGIGLMGLLIPFILPAIMKIYVDSLGYGLPLFLLRGIISALLLLGPTVLMGGTLPIISRLMLPTPKGYSFIGWLYGINTAGGVVGTLTASFYFLRLHDITVATIAAVSLNFILFLTAFSLSFLPLSQNNLVEEGHRGPIDRHEKNIPSPLFLPVNLIYLVIAFSGMSALGAEVVWTRLLSLSLGGTVYTFSLLLAAFLTGLAGGSAVASKLVRRSALFSEIALGLTQLAVIPAIIWAAWAITRAIPVWLPAEASNPLKVFAHDFFLCCLSLWPAAFFWGATFPLCLASAGKRQAEPGKLVGRIYAANTVGSIAGSLLFGLVFLPKLGSSGCQKLFIFIQALTSGLIFYSLNNRVKATNWLKIKPIEGLIQKKQVRVEGINFLGKNFFTFSRQDKKKRQRIFGALIILIIYFIIISLSWKFFPSTPWQLIAYGWKAAEKKDRGKPLLTVEGINSSVAVTNWNGTIVFHTGGRAEASNALSDLRMERMLAHLPALIHPEPRKVLVIGCGAGITAGAFLLYPGVEKVVICEIEPAVWEKVVPFFRQENYHLDSDPRVELIIEDARHFLLTTKEKFDLISSDPVHPWLKGSAFLYTQEYFEMIKGRLQPGGLFSQWIPLYESDEATVKSMLATFFRVFPDGLIWSNDFLGIDYDFVLMGQKDDLVINIDNLQAKLKKESFRLVAESLKEIYFRSALELLATYAGRRLDLASWLEGAEINLDRNLRLQYLAGWGLHLPYRISLLEILSRNFRFPGDLIQGSQENLEALEKMWRPDMNRNKKLN